MPMYRKKPVVIEARQLTRENMPELMEWCGGMSWRSQGSAITGIMITTLEGYLHAAFGYWIIKGVKGEFYPCKPDIFEATYTSEE